ncbi:Holliday junction resolvase [Serinicoccus chungangensis]|uniref:Crossover junction endodeoxyribonuclease RuvC n=1 Tax=Serinicoccus chungangensis TaxID=767452 RepID=A0A0W8I782_9MICO|nr:crossover junction endodeoxyribonuclease RuvC [Serinicoccus chungangensis]KUG54457.1 Holliday junction resolvase [Serinicoccus chungangensis]
MRVLGVDPGLTRCGLGVVEGLPGRSLRLVEVGVVRTPPGDEPAERLLTLQTEIDEWLARTRPDAVAVERVFASTRNSSIMGVAQASAVPMLAAARLGLPLVLHTPSEVKAAVTGNGRADKAQVTHMVTRILTLEQAPRPADAADALALAICHLWRGAARVRADDAAGDRNRLQDAEDQASRAAPNRLAQLHAEHRTAARSATSRASARAGGRAATTSSRRNPR